MTAAGIGPVPTADTIVTFNLSTVYVSNRVVTCVFMILCINDWGRQTLGLQN